MNKSRIQIDLSDDVLTFLGSEAQAEARARKLHIEKLLNDYVSKKREQAKKAKAKK